MNFGQRKLAGSRNIILNTCGETFNVVGNIRRTGAETTSSHVEIKIISVLIQMDYHFY